MSTVGSNQIWDVNPVNGNKSVILNADFDGMTFSSDGKTLYGADLATGTVQGRDIATKTKVFESAPIAGLDGSSLGTGSLAGNIFVNTNHGDVYEVILSTNVQTLIASGGSRGDFVTVDPTNGTLLLTQTDSALRLTAPAGGGFGTAVPEPGSVTLLGIAVVGLAGYGWRRRKAAIGV